MGTFREMAVSGQTSSHQDGKCVRARLFLCVCVCFSIIGPTGDRLRVDYCEPQPLNCL